MKSDFLKYAVSQGLNSMHVENIMSRSMDSTRASSGYISPTILEERQYGQCHPGAVALSGLYG